MPASGETVKCCLILSAVLVSLSRAGAGLLDQAPEGWTYNGCFADRARAMNAGQPAPGHPFRLGSNMTVRTCQDYAIQYGFRYFGLQAGFQCFMSNNMSRATACGRVADVDKECSTPCTGLPNATCGGYDVNAIYRLEDSGEASAIGCYYDTSEDRCRHLRAFPILAPKEIATPAKCADAAKSLNQTLLALQGGHACFVGSDYARAVAGGYLPDKDCEYPCQQDNSYYCGGDWANAVYVLQEGGSTAQPSDNSTAKPNVSTTVNSTTKSVPNEALLTPSGLWSTAQKVGIALGIAAGVCTIAGFVFGMWRHCQKKKKKKTACTLKDSQNEHPAALEVVMR